MSRLFDTATRNEKVLIRLELDKTLYEKYKPQVIQLINKEKDVYEGDTVKIDYSFEIGYFNHIENAFTALIEMANGDPQLFKSLDIQELIHGEILCERLFVTLRRLITRLKESGL